MVLILTKVTANNKFQIKRYFLAEGYFRQKAGRDTQLERNKEYAGKKLALIDKNREALKRFQKTPTFMCPVAIPAEVDNFGNVTKAKIEYEERERNYCTIPEKITIAYEDKYLGEAVVEQKDYYDLIRESQQALDLFKKSQYTARKERPWGKKQKPKAFRYQAGEKIKEGGAVIDRFVGAKNSHMITLTLPGDTWEAMDVLSRWSGWIINRLIQTIRNLGENSKNIYWFFVWEHQKRGALHLHFCLGWRTFWLKRENLANQIKDKFYGLLREIGNKESVDMFERKGGKGSWAEKEEKWQWDIQKVQKSVAAYFAKYCQKNAENSRYNGDKQDRNGGTDGTDAQSKDKKEAGLYPSRYWGSSRTVKKRCAYLQSQRKHTFTDIEDAEYYADSIRRKIGEVFNFKGIHTNDFQIKDERSKQIVCSGTVETYVVHPDDFVDFWTYINGIIIERDKTNNNLYDELLETQKEGYYDLDVEKEVNTWGDAG